ncbi:MAG TPA: UpxY family transcription antiterminator [Phaeodactylibacter sp.]|nr:UpxY family transcription antiterminator [Phaeodactylibacter sp.]
MSAIKTYENHLDEYQPRWFAIYTAYKREKLVLKMLQAKGIHAYLPLQKVVRRYVRKVKKLEIPLINCYLFVKITKAEYIRVLETEQVLKFIRFSNNLLSIPEEEIQLMKRIIGEALDYCIEPATFVEGEEVEVIGGALTGLEGKLISIKGNHSLLIELTNIGYQFRMDIPPSLLRRKKGFLHKAKTG